MPTIHNVKYGAYLTPANLAGDSLDVQVPSDLMGGTVTRTVADGDIVAAFTVSPDETALPDLTAVLYTVTGGAFIANDNQPQPGDQLVATCTEDDVSHQSGSIAVVAENGTIVPAQFGLIFGALQSIPQPPPAPQAGTPMADFDILPGDGVLVVSFDTTDQPCALNLPENAEARLLHVANRNGPNPVTISIPANPYALHSAVGAPDITLQPGQRVVLGSFGAGWDSTTP